MVQKVRLDLSRFRDRYAEISERLQKHAPGAPPRIVIVTKYLEPADCRALLEAGFSPLGENRAPELDSKTAPGDGPVWHFIGHLQRNKISKVLPPIALLHSIDSERLANGIEEWLARQELNRDGLVQVNVSGESSKGGLAPADALEKIPSWIERFSHLRLRGLMTMAPFEAPEDARPVFKGLRDLRDQIRSRLPSAAATEFAELSMGMSNDYTIAAEEGATLLRLGSLLYR